MPKIVCLRLCSTAILFLIIYVANKENTVGMDTVSRKIEMKKIGKSKSNDINSVVQRLYSGRNDNKAIGMIKLQVQKYAGRRLLSNEDDNAKQVNDSSVMNEKDSVTKIYKFRDDIQEMCPFADFCQLKAKEEIRRPFISCCRSCYCDKDCGRRDDCCLTEDDEYSSEKENTTICMKTAIHGWGGSILSAIKEYRIVDRCLNPEQTCKDKSSSPWGALFPGYSPTSDYIYYNSHCAACNNVQDFQPWKFYIISNFSGDISNEMLFDALQGKRYPIVFIPPTTDTLTKHECFKSAINYCNMTGNWKNYDPGIKEACQSFQAPVFHTRSGIIYSNIYCLVCNQEVDEYEDKCMPHPLYLRGITTGITQTALTGLFDFVTISETSSLESTVSSGKECPIHTVQHPYKVKISRAV